MGCWNGVCAISNLPILYGDKIVLIYLENKIINKNISDFNNGSFYSNDYYDPLYLPIFGKYNDYGDICEIIHHWNTEYIFNIYKNKCKKFINDSNIDLDSIENLSELVNRRYLKYLDKDEVEKYLNLSFTMIRKDIWDSVIEIMKQEITYGYPLTANYASHYEYNLQMVNSYFKDIINVCEEIGNSKNDSLNFSSLLKLNTSIDNYRNTVLKNYYDYLIKLYIDDKNYFNHVKKYFIDIFVEYQCINDFIKGIKKVWLPATELGSQDDDWNLYIKFSDVVKGIAIKNCGIEG